MKLGGLVERVSRIMRTDADKVARAARGLREAGMLTSTGARGISAPAMAPLDAARLLIAFLADPAPGNATAELVQRYGSLPAFGIAPEGGLTFEALRGASPETFEAGLAMLIEVYAFDRETDAFRAASTRYRDRPDLPPECECVLSIDPQPEGRIAMHRRHESGPGYVFGSPFMSTQAALQSDPRLAPAVLRTAALHGGAIGYMAEGFRA